MSASLASWIAESSDLSLEKFHKHFSLNEAVEAISNQTVQGNNVKRLLLFLETNLAAFDVDAIADAVFRIIEALRDEKCEAFSLVPIGMNVLLGQKGEKRVVNLHSVNLENASPEAFFKTCMDRMLNVKWIRSIALPIVRNLKEQPFPKYSQFTALILKAANAILCVSKDELPELIHNILLAGKIYDSNSKGTKIKGQAALPGATAISMAILHIVQNVSELEENSVISEKQIHLMQGTLLRHFEFDGANDTCVLKSLLRLLVSKQCKLTPFALGMLFTLSRIQRFQSQIFNFLKSYAQSYYKFKQAENSSALMCRANRILNLFQPIDLLMMDVLKRTSYAWEFLAPGIISFAFFLLDSSAFRDLKVIGIQILDFMFREISAVRSKLLEQIEYRIFSSENEECLNLLYDLIKYNQHIFRGLAEIFRNSLEHFNQLSPDFGRKWLRGVSPLIISSSFRDQYILFIRKSLFGREISQRVSAVEGLITLVTDSSFAIGEDRESASQSSSSSTLRDLNSEIFVEIIGFLSRSLSQQKEVRIAVYENLRTAFFRFSSNTAVQESIIQLILNQFSKYYDSDPNSSFPLNHDVIYEDESSQEPIDELIFTLQCFICTCDLDIRERSEIYQSGKLMLDDCLDRYSKMKLDNLIPSEVGPSSEKDAEKGNNDITRSLCALNQKIISCMLEYHLNSRTEFSENDFNILSKLFRFFQKLNTESSTSKPNAKNPKGKLSKSNMDINNLGLSFEGSLSLLQLFGNQQNQFERVFSEVELKELKYFVIKSCLANLSKMKDSADLERIGVYKKKLSVFIRDDALEYLFNGCIKISKFISFELFNNISISKKTNSGSQLNATIESLLEICALNFSLFKTFGLDFSKKVFVEMFGEEVLFVSESSAAADFMKKFSDVFVEFFSSLSTKSAVCFISIFDRLLEPISDAGVLSYHLERMISFLQQGYIHNSEIATKLVSHIHRVIICIAGSDTETAPFQLLTYLAKDCHSLLGDIEENNVEPLPLQFNIVSDVTCTSLLQVTCTLLEDELFRVEQLFSELRNITVGVEEEAVDQVQLQSNDNASSREKKRVQDLLFLYLQDMFKIAEQIVRTDTPLSIVELVVKVSSHLFKCLSLVTKTLMSAQEYPPQQFKKIIRIASLQFADSVFRYVDEKDKKAQESGIESKAKLSRESRLVPELVYQIEQLDHFIIKYSKATKSNLDVYLKRRAARDFKIDKEEVEALVDPNSDKSKEKKSKRKSNAVSSQPLKKGGLNLNAINPFPENAEGIVVDSITHSDSDTEIASHSFSIPNIRQQGEGEEEDEDQSMHSSNTQSQASRFLFDV